MKTSPSQCVGRGFKPRQLHHFPAHDTITQMVSMVSVVAILIFSFPPARAVVIEGAYDEHICHLEWHPWAVNATFYDRPSRYYAIAHGYESRAFPFCGRPDITPDMVEAGGYGLGFFAHCDGMCSNANGTFAEAVGESVGYCGMSEPLCAGCWMQTVAWQDVFYRNVDSLGASGAFDAAMNSVPECLPCLRYHKKREPEQVDPAITTITGIIVPWLMRNR